MMISLLGAVEYNTVFCDWLSVSYSPDNNVVPELEHFLLSHDFVLDQKSSDDAKWLFRPLACRQFGVVRIEFRFRFVVVFTSGAAFSFLRFNKLIPSYLSLLGTQPHRVTRLDLSIDLEKDFPPVLDGFRRHYPDGQVSFSRKKHSYRTYLATRADGQESGTLYIGTNKSSISAKIYDKQLEMLEQHNEPIPVCTRYEVSFHKKSTLKDAHNGVPLFWKYAAVLLLDYLRPKNVPDWFDGTAFIGWASDYDPLPPYARMQRLLEQDSLIEALERVSSLMPNGLISLDKLLHDKISLATAKRLAKLATKEFTND